MTSKKNTLVCKICSSPGLSVLNKEGYGEYFKCKNCNFIFKASEERINKKEEVKRYLSHQNYYNDKRYRDYLSQIIEDLQIGEDNNTVLDYGCGYQPVMSELLRENGTNAYNYDLYFNKNETVFDKKYDEIISVETFEHLNNPMNTIKKLKNCLKNNGQLKLVTNLFDKANVDFFDWWYIKDPTHISLYSTSTMYEIKEIMQFESVNVFGKKYIIFQNQ